MWLLDTGTGCPDPCDSPEEPFDMPLSPPLFASRFLSCRAAVEELLNRDDAPPVLLLLIPSSRREAASASLPRDPTRAIDLPLRQSLE